MDWDQISDIPQVIELIKKRDQIEQEIRELDNMALVRYELQWNENEQIKEQVQINPAKEV